MGARIAQLRGAKFDYTYESWVADRDIVADAFRDVINALGYESESDFVLAQRLSRKDFRKRLRALAK